MEQQGSLLKLASVVCAVHSLENDSWMNGSWPSNSEYNYVSLSKFVAAITAWRVWKLIKFPEHATVLTTSVSS